MSRANRVKMAGLSDRDNRHLRMVRPTINSEPVAVFVDYDDSINNSTEKRLRAAGVQIITTERYKALTRIENERASKQGFDS